MLSILLPFRSFTDAIEVLSHQFSIRYLVSQNPLIIVSFSVSFTGCDIVPVRSHRIEACILVEKFADRASVFHICDSVQKTIAEVLRTLRSAYVGSLTQHLRICAL